MKPFRPAAPARHVVDLQPGQAVRTAVRRGATVVVQAGAVRLAEPPRWLAGTVFQPVQRLAEGAAWQVDAGGWLDLVAGADGARLALLAPIPAGAGWLRRLARYGIGRPYAASLRALLSGDSTSAPT